MNPSELSNPWLAQSAVTQVDQSSKAIDELPSSPPNLREVSQRLVVHCMGNSDGSTGPITGEHLKEVDVRFAETMFLRLLETGQATLSSVRPPDSLRRLGVKNLLVEGDKLTVDGSNPEEENPRILNAIFSVGGQVESVSVIGSTLEDAYLKLVRGAQ